MDDEEVEPVLQMAKFVKEIDQPVHFRGEVNNCSSLAPGRGGDFVTLRRMESVEELIDNAFQQLSGRQGFLERPDQRQLALMLGDCIGEEKSGIFEAPTGLGK